MVLFTTKFFRKLFYSKFSSVYVNKIVQLFMKSQAEEGTEIRDDDLRGNSTLLIERIGIYDGLSNGYLVPKTGTTIDYWTSEFPDKSLITGWWLADHLNHAWSIGKGYLRDHSYFDRHAQVYGDPCIVSGGAGLVLPWRPDSIVTSLDGIDDAYRVSNISAFQVGSQSFSIPLVIYPKSFAKTNRYNKNCIYFDGSIDGISDYLDMGTATGAWSQSHTKFTFSMWVKWNNGGIPDTPDDTDYDQQRSVLGVNDTNFVNSLYLYWSDAGTNGLSYNAISAQVTNDGLVTQNLRYSSQAAQNDHWYHIVVVYDSTLGSANLKLYLDGVLQSSTADLNATGDTIALGSSAVLYIGKWGVDDTNEFGGRVKDFQWWSDTALSGTDVTNLFTGNVGAVTAPNNQWMMNEGEGTNIVDIIAGSESGNLINGARWDTDPTFSYSVLEFQKLVTKRDDATNKYTVWLETDGKIYVRVTEGGSNIDKTITSALSLNTWYWIVITYNTSTNTILIYKDASEISTATGAHAPDFDNKNIGSTWNDLFFFSNNHKTGNANCAVYLFGFESGAVMSSTEVTNLFNNKATLTDLTGAQVAMVNYAIPS